MGHKEGASHEYICPKSNIKVGPERSFGLVFAVVFSLIAMWPLTNDGEQVLWWAFAIAGVFLVLSLVAPKVLKPLNVLWFKFGLLLHAIVQPFIMGLIFFLTVTPTAFLFRLLKKDPLRLKKQPDAESYWIVRDPPGPAQGSMKNQF